MGAMFWKNSHGRPGHTGSQEVATPPTMTSSGIRWIQMLPATCQSERVLLIFGDQRKASPLERATP